MMSRVNWTVERNKFPPVQHLNAATNTIPSNNPPPSQPPCFALFYKNDDFAKCFKMLKMRVRPPAKKKGLPHPVLQQSSTEGGIVLIRELIGLLIASDGSSLDLIMSSVKCHFKKKSQT